MTVRSETDWRLQRDLGEQEEAKLPFASKTKNLTKKSKTGYLAKRAVVLEPEEKKKVAFLQALGTVRNEKKAKR